MASTDAAPQAGAGWDEARCKAALAELEQVREQLDDLRLTIHRIVQPLSAPLTDNPLLFTTYKQATVGSQNDIKAFRAQWQNPEIQSIFEHTKESFQASSDLSASTQVPRYGWKQNEITETDAAPRRKNEKQTLEDVPASLNKEDIAKIMEDFQKTNPQIKVGTKDDDRDWLIQFVSGSLKLRFHIVINREANGRDKLDAECLGTTQPFTTISRCVSSRTRANDLKYLLDMIAAYKTVKASTCAKCERLLDITAQIPTARRSKQVSGDSADTGTPWEAFHESCLD